MYLWSFAVEHRDPACRRGRLRLLVANHKSTLVDYVVEAAEGQGGALEVAVVPVVEWDLSTVGAC